MGFGSTRLRPAWDSATKRAPKRRDLSPLLRSLPSARNIAELGPEGGSLAGGLLQAFPEAVYRAFDVSDAEIGRASAELAPFRGRAFTTRISPSCELPLPDASLDLLLTCHVLEHLRMDQLYMVCSEARRVLKPGGRWLLASDALRQGLLGSLRSWLTGNAGLELTHYISPEDWETESDRTERGVQSLLLCRLAG